MQIIKRNGNKVNFDSNKIKLALTKAYNAWGGTFADDITLDDIVDEIVDECFEGITVEEIQDIVVEQLEKFAPELATIYSKYRAEREYNRAKNLPRLEKAIKDIVEEKTSDVTKENSNRVTSEIATKMQLIGEETNKYAFNSDPDIQDIVELHNKGAIHVHDTSYWAIDGVTNCSLLNIKDMLLNGTVINDVQITKPHSLQTASTIMCQIASKVRKDQYGGMTVNISDLAYFVRMDHDNLLKESLDFGMTPKQSEKYVKSKLAKSITAAVQTINYQVQTLSDDIFISIGLDIHGWKGYEKETYLLIEEFLKQRIQGLPDERGQYVTQTFPKLLFVTYDEMFDKNNKYYPLLHLAAISTAKRMSPDFVSAKKSMEYKEGNVVLSMGCRSELSPWKDSDGNYKFWGRGNLGVVSLNLPYIALDAKYNYNKANLEGFKERLKFYFNKALKAHKARIRRILACKVDIAPILWMYGAFSRAKPGTLIGDVVKNGYFTASFGYMGLAEAVNALGVKYETKEGQQLGVEILKYFNRLCDEAKKNSPMHISYSIYGTPAESTVKKFANACKIFPVTKDVNDRKYITNSFHIPVHYNIDAFSKIDFESVFQKYSLGGSISYIESGNLEKNIDAVEELIKYMNDKMYYCEFNIRHADVCHVCGYHGEIQYAGKGIWKCPNCGNTDIRLMTRVRRVCGYLSSNDWNTARTDEINNRVIHIQ